MPPSLSLWHPDFLPDPLPASPRPPCTHCSSSSSAEQSRTERNRRNSTQHRTAQKTETETEQNRAFSLTGATSHHYFAFRTYLINGAHSATVEGGSFLQILV